MSSKHDINRGTESSDQNADSETQSVHHLLASANKQLAGLLRDSQIDENESLRNRVSKARKAVGDASRLIRKLDKHRSKIPLNKSPIETRDMIEGAFDLFSRNMPETFRLRADIRSDIWEINGDETQIHQALIHIFENALHATNGFGRLSLTARNFVLYDRDMSEAFECIPGHYVIITIADDGAGMSDAIRDKVFEPFFTTKEAGLGSGMGLTTTRQIVRQHNGHITCTSAEGEGTAFSLYLPRHKVVKHLPQRLKQNTPDNLKEKNPGVLVVEDESLLRNLVRSLCEKHGYRSFGAADGLEALEFIRENPDDIFAAVIDLAMPRMTGTELYRQMNTEGINIPIIVASGFLVDSEKFVEETGGTPHAIFSKPYQLSELLTSINELREMAGLKLPQPL